MAPYVKTKLIKLKSIKNGRSKTLRWQVCWESCFIILASEILSLFDHPSGQGRLDGAFCEYTLEDKLKFLRKVYDAGVCNIEMESVCFAAMCKRAGVRAAILCATLVDRLKGDQVNLTKEQHEDFEMRPARLVSKFIKKTLAQSNRETCCTP